MPALRCAVIGAGVVGLCVAVRLAEAGATVTLLERDEPGCGATRLSFAWLNANSKIPRAYHDLNHAGMRAWACLAAGAGQPAWYQASGNLEWAPDARGHAELAARVRRLAEWGYPAGFSMRPRRPSWNRRCSRRRRRWRSPGFPGRATC